MFLFNVPTNVFCIPTLVVLYRKRLAFQFCVGFFTAIASFTYHLCESIAAERILLTELEWHKLDNIGSIVCFVMMFVYWADVQNDFLELMLNMSALLLAVTLQEGDPWNINYTVGPILLYISALVAYKLSKHRFAPVLNLDMVRRAGLLIAAGFVCFYFAIDEFSDYLRIWHGLWHVSIGLSSFYTWQAKSKPSEVLTLLDLVRSRPKHYLAV
jgi:hypothetical protein